MARRSHGTAPSRIAAKQRQLRALELRKRGATYEQIARSLGYGTRAGALKAVQRALDGPIREVAQEIVALELERLDKLWVAVWPDAIGEGGRPPSMRAIDRCLKIMDRRAKLLGLDATKVKPILTGVAAEAASIPRAADFDPVLLDRASAAIGNLFAVATRGDDDDDRSPLAGGDPKPPYSA